MLVDAGCSSRGTGGTGGAAGSSSIGGAPAIGGNGGALSGAGGEALGTGGANAGVGGAGGASSGTGGASSGTGGTASGSGGAGTSVGATSTRGSLQLYGTQTSVAAVTAPTLAWIGVTDPTNSAASTPKLLTFDTPVESPGNSCGRVSYVDFHVKVVPATQNGKDSSDPTKPFPTGCQSPILTPQEQALEFLLFDAGACIQ